MLPEEDIAGRGFGLWRPEILHIVKQFHIFLQYGDVKGTKRSSGGCVGPNSVNGKALTESLFAYLSQSIT